MDSVRSAFHTQVAAVMESLLAAAVCEIAKIFENSMCEQQAQISSLLAKLEQVERRQSTMPGGGGTAGEGEDTLRTKRLIEAGKEPDGVDNKSSRNKPKEVTDSNTSVKQEPPLASQDLEENVITDQRITDSLTDAHTKGKLSHCNQMRPTEDRPQHESVCPPFLSTSKIGCCSPGNETSLSQPRQWLPVLDDTRGRMCSQEGLQVTGTSCFVTAGTSTGTDMTENNTKEEINHFVFTEHKPEKHNSHQKTEHNLRAEQTEVQQHQPQVLSPWSDDRSGSFSHARQALCSNRDSLRRQSSSEALKTRQASLLSRSGAPSGGSGRPYTCPYCAKTFTYPSHQRRHLLRHTGVRLHPCQFCDKSFLTPSELTVHTRTHTGERPFGCVQCGKRFARSGNLRAHQRDVHMRKRPFACAECGKRFAHRGNLRVHNHRVHQGDPYYMEQQQEPDIAST
ncbi:uncharacterized protein LOC144059582 isoform X2 [Vanacampus margaritifer]